MNRRSFLQFLGMATVGGTVAYSFPSIIVPKNIITVQLAPPLFESTPLNYNAFYSLYMKAIKGNALPSYILANDECKQFIEQYTILT